MKVRPAVAEDAACVVVLESAAFGSSAWSLDGVLAELTGTNRLAAVATIETTLDDAAVVDLIVGYAAISLAGEFADLTRVAVVPGARRKGAGTALVAWAVGAAESAGAERMLLEVAATNDPALAVYERAGFAEIARRRGYYPGTTDALVLERRIR